MDLRVFWRKTKVGFESGEFGRSSMEIEKELVDS